MQIPAHPSQIPCFQEAEAETNIELFYEAHRAVNVPMCCFLNTELFLKSRTALFPGE